MKKQKKKALGIHRSVDTETFKTSMIVTARNLFEENWYAKTSLVHYQIVRAAVFIFKFTSRLLPVKLFLCRVA